MEYKSLEDIVINLPIYRKIEICFANDHNKLTDDGRELLKILFHKDKINLKCIECKKEYPFEVSHMIIKENFMPSIYKIIMIGLMLVSIDDKLLLQQDVTVPLEDDGIVIYTFKCTMNQSHYYKMFLKYSLLDKKIIITKIGQFPLTTLLRTNLSNRFEMVLKKYDSYEDYRLYEQSYERNLLAGSCTYLRRIFEKMVFKMMDDGNISDSQKKSAIHFADKIKIVKSQFDIDIRDVLEECYNLLSKGIHELKNDEIQMFHDLMSEVINVQLESETEKMIRDKSMKELRKSIHREHNNLK